MTTVPDTTVSPAAVTVRAASAGDYDAAARLFKTHLGDGFTLDAALWEGVCSATTHRALVAEDAAGAVVALVTVVVNERIRLAGGTRRRRFHIDDLIVDPAARRRGIARTLLGKVIAMAREERPTYIVVNCDFTNIAARRTYESAGLHLVRQSSDRFEIALI